MKDNNASKKSAQRASRANALEKMNTKIDEKKYKEFVENVELLTHVLTRNINKETVSKNETQDK